MMPPKSNGAAKPDAGGSSLPLSGIIVADFSRLLPGPWCTQMLGDFGATVIKVEQRGVGDPSRYNPPRYRDESVYYRSVNANKQGISLDLTKPEGVEVAHRLLRKADVMVESFRPAVCVKLKIDYATVHKLNSRAIYCAISGFGQSGPLSHIPGHDLVVQAMTGVLRAPQNGEAFTLPPFQAADYAAGAMACIGILAALRQRDYTGTGCYLDVSMFESMMHMANISLLPGLSILAGGTGQPRLEAWGANPRYSVYPTRDGGYVAVSLLEAKLWAVFCNVIGRADLISASESQQDRHSDHGERAALYREAIADYCLSKDRDDLTADLCAKGVPILPVLAPEEAVKSAHVVARDIAGVVNDDREGQIAELRNPFRSSSLARQERTPAPAFGEDGVHVLGMLGYSKSEADVLAKKGII
jgi:crotonobetainyl-CoA:carnitine CoA-transferase CaiB-like acyl-CoA transferase